MGCMASNDDPLERIAESLANLERLYAGEVRHQEEQRKELAERQKDFDERQKKWDKRDDEWRKQGLFRNPWTQPREIAYLLLALALFVLSITVYALLRP